MRALRFHEFGAFDKLKVEAIPDPQPKPAEVVVRIRAASLSPSDAKNVLGRMEGTTLPRTPGRDFAGVVVNGPSQMIGSEVWGTGGDIGFTRDGAHAVTQIAKWKGGRTIGVDRAPVSQETQEQFGIDHFLVADANENYKSMIDGALRSSAGKGVNIVFDCVGGPLFEPCLKTLGQLGRQVNITSVGDRRVCFDLLDFYHRRLTLFGVDSRAYDTEACAAILERLTPGFESGALKPIPIAKRFSLNEAVQAFTQVNEGTLRGKAVFTFPADGA